MPTMNLWQGFVPPYLLRAIAERGAEGLRQKAWAALTDSEQTRGQRILMAALGMTEIVPAGGKRRTVYDAANTFVLPGKLVRGEGSAKGKDAAVNEAYDGSGAVYDFFAQVYGRNSIDNRGMRLDSTVHYGEDYDNAFWNGRQMVYGDGDGEIFNRFTCCLDVIAHELSHGVIQNEANLQYRGQSGALSESVADVFGALVRQFAKNQTAAEADWLIGAGLFRKGINAKAVRSMKEPGTAYDDPVLGKDPQPAHMSGYIRTTDDNGGVHLNSGIPNRAFYEVAIRLGGHAWEKAGMIWYKALCDRMKPLETFEDMAKHTVAVAKEMGVGKIVQEGWRMVGLNR